MGLEIPYRYDAQRTTPIPRIFLHAATIIDVTRPQTVGRVLGIGLRAAGRLAGQTLAGETRANAPVTVAGVGGPGTAAPPSRAKARQAGRTTVNAARGVSGFIRPFKRLGGILFLEVTGVFFLLFVAIFGNWAWKLRASYAHGPDHARFVTFAVLTLVFLYLGLSSFWRAKRK